MGKDWLGMDGMSCWETVVSNCFDDRFDSIVLFRFANTPPVEKDTNSNKGTRACVDSTPRAVKPEKKSKEW